MLSNNHSDHYDSDRPPVIQTSDYVGIGVLAAMLCIGGPLNVLSLLASLGIDAKSLILRQCGCVNRTNSNSQSSVERRRKRNRSSIKFSLNFHLTLANLLVIWVYVLSEVCWRFTFQWLGGDILCRLCRFVHAFCFYATSNLVCTIALDRLHIAIRIDRPGGAHARSNAVRWFANCAWTLAFICSLPQLFVWRTFEFFPEEGWSQCVSIFTIAKYNHTPAITDNLIRNITQNSIEIDLEQRIDEATYHEKLYNGFHLAFVFWLPVFSIIISYALIVTRFHRDIRKSKKRRGEAMTNQEPTSFNETDPISNTIATPILTNKQADKKISKKKSGIIGQKSILDCCDPFKIKKRNQNRFRNRCQHSNSNLQNSIAITNITTTTTNVSLSDLQSSIEPPKSEIGTISDYELSRPATNLNAAIIGVGQPLLPTPPPPPARNFAATTLMRAKRRTVKKSAWILLAYFVCWSPYNVLSLWRYLDPEFEHPLLEILYDLIVLNAVVNPLIYGI